MNVLKDIEPVEVFKFFEEISSIPHGSGNTRMISDYIVSFAQKRKLEYFKDKSGSVIIIKEATKDKVNSGPIILQAHIDMVCEKLPGVMKNFEKEGIDIYVDDDFIKAKGTTLGADNGIGVSLILALLDDNCLSHPRIEAIFTTDEETGMNGAFSIDLSNLLSKRILNLDGGNDSCFIAGSAGGVAIKSTFDLSRKDKYEKSFKITVSGVKGGHSGDEIIKGGASANILLSRVLNDIYLKTDIKISSVMGGLKENAICSYSEAVICSDDKDLIFDITDKLNNAIKKEYSVTDPDIRIEADMCGETKPFDIDSTKKILLALSVSPHGVLDKNNKIENNVQSSVNFAITNTNGNKFETVISIRSSLGSQKEFYKNKYDLIYKFLGGKTDIHSDYPEWEFIADSEFKSNVFGIYKDYFKHDAKIYVTHGGLEVGILLSKIPDCHCLSFGPCMYDIHTPYERVSISSVSRVWGFMKYFLERL